MDHEDNKLSQQIIRRVRFSANDKRYYPLQGKISESMNLTSITHLKTLHFPNV